VRLSIEALVKVGHLSLSRGRSRVYRLAILVS
jgi:hypothetical protein